MTTERAPSFSTSKDSSSLGIIPPEIDPSATPLGEFTVGDPGDAAARVLHVAQHAGRRGDEHQRVGPQRAGQLARHRVAVDVERLSLPVAAQAGQHRHVAAGPQVAEEAGG